MGGQGEQSVLTIQGVREIHGKLVGSGKKIKGFYECKFENTTF